MYSHKKLRICHYICFFAGEIRYTYIFRVRLVEIQILLETFQIQIFSRNVSLLK
jgi:hypothetical protein